jgi:3-oxoacyl-[acyl-carrier protein] reductase
MTLTGKRALVTGAGRSIGAAVAKVLVAEGVDISITYDKYTESNAAEVVSAIKAKGRKGVAIQVDGTDLDTLQGAVDKAVAELGGLDVLINAAGAVRLGELEDILFTEIDALLTVNVRAPLIASKAALAYLDKGGRIITIGSYDAERTPTPVLCVYAAIKSAQAAFTKALARELAPREITVNLVQPGSIDTDINPATNPHAENAKQFLALGRYGFPENIANAVAFLASAKAQYITGSTLTVDGGTNA